VVRPTLIIQAAYRARQTEIRRSFSARGRKRHRGRVRFREAAVPITGNERTENRNFGDQQRFSVGEQMRLLLRILALRSAEEMRGGYEFIRQ
jgi:hypothetical protein